MNTQTAKHEPAAGIKGLQHKQPGTMRAEEKLEEKRRQIQEMTITLKNIVQAFEQDKKEQAQDLARRVAEDVLPESERMAREEDQALRHLRKEVIEDQLTSMVSSDDQNQGDADMLKLTPTEIDVCDYIRAGRSTSEIADLMYLSLDTIQTHRKNIRKKLGLVGRKISLYSYLRSRQEM
ncbi:MAG: helix-turn-helix transcriptional regulator [Desulfonatronovibrionaceae bacterium]